MRKGLIFSLIISIIGFLGLSIFAFIPKTNFSIDKTTKFAEFELSLASELQNDDYSYIKISKNVTLNQLKQNIEPNKTENTLNTNFNLGNNKILTSNQIADYCSSNNLILKETTTSYLIRNEFGLKRLIIYGELPGQHKASKVITYDDMHILCYNSIEDTKNAYYSLLKNNIKVSIDSVVSVESDEFIEAQSSLNNWSETAINLSAYSGYRTDKQIVVAVLDTGINTLHELFKNRLLTENGKIVGTSYYTSSYTYNKNNIQHSTIQDFGSNLSFEDDHGHGTHVAGIIVSQTPENVKILPMRVLGTDGKGSSSAIIGALEKIEQIYSNTYKIACTNLSLGGEVTEGFDTALNNYNTIFNKLKAKNILNVVAAGNRKSNPQNTAEVLPAACGDSAIVVSALKETTNFYGVYTGMEYDSSYSNFGISVDISAPGTGIYSAYKASFNSSSSTYINKYAYMDGTSQATPHVSACVALLCLDNDYYSTSTASYTSSEIESRIYNSATDLGNPKKDEKYGWGALCYTNIDTLQDIAHTSANNTVTYNGNYHNITINVTKPATGYTIKYSLENDNTYTITNINGIAQFKNANENAITVYYQITAPGYNPSTGSKTLKINKRELTYNIENQTSTYGNYPHIDTTKYSKISGTVIDGDNLNLKLNTNATQTSNAGNYNITLTLTNSNYSIISNTATLTINPRDIDIEILNSSSEYGESFTINHLNYKIIGGNLFGNDSLGVILNDSAININHMGNYDITLQDWTNKNYNIRNAETVKGTHTVTPINITVNISDQTSVYGEYLDLDTTKFTISGKILSGDNLNIKLTSTAANTSATNYTITATYTENSNYVVTINEGKYIVTKRPISLKTGNQTSTYGEQISLNQTNYSITSGSFVFNDNQNVTLSTSATKTSIIGSYEIDLTFDAINNYDLTLEKGSLTINPRELTISLLNHTIEYGNILKLDKSSYSIINGSIVNNDIVEISLSSITNPENYEEYLINATSSNKNYTIKIENSQITVAPRKITISTKQTKVYGSEIALDGSVYSVTKGSIVNNDNLQLVFTTLATKTSNVGKYEITLVSANKNYEVTLENSILTIIPKTIDITVLNQSGYYGFDVKLDNTQYLVDENEIVEGGELLITLTTNANKTTNVGKYTIAASTANPNYTLQTTNGIYEILKRKISIRLYNQSTTHTIPLRFNKEDYDIMSGSVVAGDELNVILFTNATNFSFAGDYELMATYANENYDITFTEATLTIEFSYIDALMIVVPAIVVILVATTILAIIIKRKNKTTPLYKKWTN